MTEEQIKMEIELHLGVGDIKGAIGRLDSFFSSLPDFEASKQISEVILKLYSYFRAGLFGVFLEFIIRKRPNLAQVNYPENFLFKLCVITGSKDFYKCFIEEAAEPFLKDKNEEEKMEYYLDLHIISLKLNDLFFPEYEPYLKGLHYNGAFASPEGNDNVVLIHRGDYDIMEEIIENYNRIVGRRLIVDDLEKKASGEE